MSPSLETIKQNTKPGLFLKKSELLLPTYWGFNFEIFCQKNIHFIIEKLEISESEIISIGPYFKQAGRITKIAKATRGAQVDMMIIRKGFIITLIEIKFKTDPVDVKIIKEIEAKIKALLIPKKYTIEKVLVTANEVSEDLEAQYYFNQIINLKEFYS